MLDAQSRLAAGRPRGHDRYVRGLRRNPLGVSRLYDYQTRRLNLRYRDPSDPKGRRTVFCHSLNNTVAASPRLLIPILEMYQNADGTVTVPEVLRPHMQGQERIG